MHDIRFIREEAHTFDSGLKRRGLDPLSKELMNLDEERRRVMTSLQDLQSHRNKLSKEIGQFKAKGDHEKADSLMAEVTKIKEDMTALEARDIELQEDLEARLLCIPNLPAEDVPVGKDENDNQEIRRYGTPRSFSFEPKAHDVLGEDLGFMDFESAARVSGSRFVYLKSDLARLERALAAFMLDTHTSLFGYTEVSPPLLVNSPAMVGTGQLPKFADDLFQTTQKHWLIPTAEVSLTNLVLDQIIDTDRLPLRFTAHTPCFRAEAGAAGRDTRGMVRLHQFSKVELVSITLPEDSCAEHERMTEAAETILKKLELPFRTILLCTGDMGFSAIKTYDLEVWLPAQNTYREISSCSNCGDFQARRMKARTRLPEGKGTRFVHTLNGSGLAVGRTMVAVMENYQNEDGSITLPNILHAYMGGKDRIEKIA
jgi:seryl-tRNA synthetase